MALYRTWLFIPGSEEKKIAKAGQLDADVILFDLEDAVAVQEKEVARERVKAALLAQAIRRHGANERANEPHYFVRVNPPDTPFFRDDVEAVAKLGITGVVLPKVEENEHVYVLEHLLDQWEADAGTRQPPIEIVPLIETARGLYHAYELAKASKRIRRLLFGSVDYALDIRATLTKQGHELLYARSHLVVASRAAGLEPPIDSVFLDVHDSAGLTEETRLARQLGFQGKLIIHPKQIAPVHDAFAPTSEERAEAESVIAAYEQSVAAGGGVILLDGKMIDLPVVERARKTLDTARSMERRKA